MNCWEFKKCGCEPGGDRVDELGVCPAAVQKDLDGTNGGENGGRCCWRVAATLCSGEVQGDLTDKIVHCFKCPFMKKVREEEGEKFKFVL